MGAALVTTCPVLCGLSLLPCELRATQSDGSSSKVHKIHSKGLMSTAECRVNKLTEKLTGVIFKMKSYMTSCNLASCIVSEQIHGKILKCCCTGYALTTISHIK